MATRTKERSQFLLDVLTTAIENGGYGFFYTEKWVWDCDPADAYAVIVDKEDESRRWRVDIDTMARGLGIIRNAVLRDVGRDGLVPHNHVTDERLYFGGKPRQELLKMDRTNGEDGDCDVIGGLAVLECALFGKVVYG